MNNTLLNLLRKDSGELRVLITLIFSVISSFFLWIGYELAKSGVAGNWQIISSFKGWSLYFSSISPGLLVIGFGAAIMIWGLPKTLKNLQ